MSNNHTYEVVGAAGSACGPGAGGTRAAAPSPPGCQTGKKLTEPLSRPSFNGQTPSGTATADETQFSGCGGLSILSASVKNVNQPDGTQLWVSLDGKSVGTITLSHGSGSMAPYSLGDFEVSMDQVQVFSSLPDVSTFQQILSGEPSRDPVDTPARYAALSHPRRGCRRWRRWRAAREEGGRHMITHCRDDK
jgi:hypothetical protein